MTDYIRDLRLAKWGSVASVHGSNPELAMSALGQKRIFRLVRVMSAILPKADIGALILRLNEKWRKSLANLVCHHLIGVREF
jgi:hypothetical protein